jgi:hypothetical protein
LEQVIPEMSALCVADQPPTLTESVVTTRCASLPPPVTFTLVVSPLPTKDIVIVAERVSPATTLPVDALIVKASSVKALAEPVDKTPTPNAATKASEIRLNVVL